MFKYGISYYTMEEGARKPQSGVDVRLLRPGADWQNGLRLIETENSGYYECMKMKPIAVSMRYGTTGAIPMEPLMARPVP